MKYKAIFFDRDNTLFQSNRKVKMIEGISHMTFIVKDLNRSAQLLRYVFDAKEVYSSDEKTFSISSEKFFLINNLWVVIMKGDSLCSKTYNHIAFKIDEKDYDTYVSRVNKLG